MSSVELHTERHGNGPQVVLTHGYGATSATWSELLPVLVNAWTTVSWDLRAHGGSGASDDGRYDQAAALADLTAVVDERPSVLIGHSFGGYLSLVLAITRPDLVRGLVLIATGPGYRNDEARDG